MVNVAELLELKFGNSFKQPPHSSHGTVGGADLIDGVRVSAEGKDEVKVEEVSISNPKVVGGLDGLIVDTSVEGVNGEGRVSDQVVGGLEQSVNELNEISRVLDKRRVSEEVGGFEQTGNEGSGIDLVVDLSPRGGSEKVGGFDQTRNELNGINLVVDLSPRGGSDGKFSNGNVVISEEDMRRECMTEIEGNYEPTDLVWGKVRSHPWWPGQIVDPASASAKAKKHFKKDGFLIAYFGDETYAWNDASQIKPFWMHFSQMVKQSSTEGFRHAVDCALSEVARRVEFGLACSCLSEDTFSEIKSQVVVNTGISEKARRRDGGDRFSSVASFEPAKLVVNVKALAVDPLGGTDRLEFVKVRAQLSAYHRWKGYYQLPTESLLNGSVENADHEPDSGKENVTEDTVAAYESDEEVKSGKGNSTARDSYSRKRKHISTKGVSSSRRVKRLLDLTPDNGLNMPNSKSVRAGRKRKVVDSLSHYSMDRSVTMDRKSLTPPPKRTYRVGESVRRIARKLSATSALTNGDRSSQKSEVPAAYPPSDEILAELYLAAVDPMKENSSLTSLVHFFTDFRSYYVEISNGNSPGNVVPNSETKEVTELDGIEDSYWPDRIIQGNPEEQVLFEPKVATLSPDSEKKKGIAVASLESNEEKPTGHLDDKCNESSGTALILIFDKKGSVPSVTNLDNIYSKYGPLKEVSTKNKRAKVVFERRSDAETAFSSAGKYSMFGPSLLKYSLDYSPAPRKINTRARKQAEEKDATPGKAEQELED